MPNVTFPNQRMIKIHRERATSDFLGIKNTNWQAAARDLGPHALMLYLYLAANADNYTEALSPAAVRQTIAMPRSTYHDQFHKLVDRGYLVPSTGNTFDFYEVPRPVMRALNNETSNGLDFTKSPASDTQEVPDGHNVLPDSIEINNTINDINNEGINNSDFAIYIPKVKEITIPRPQREPKEEIPAIPKQDFVF